MNDQHLNIVIFGLSLTSSWGNGHATTYRALIRELHAMGHRVLFLEREVPWYAANRDLPVPEYCELVLYHSMEELRSNYEEELRNADLVMMGSYVPQGVEVGQWITKTARGVTAFYDIDTPVTLAKLAALDFEYLQPGLIPAFHLYLSFTGGPVLEQIEKKYGSPRARALYCSVDISSYYPEEREYQWDLGYMGTYSSDRQPPLEQLMLGAAREWKAGRFVVAGPQYPGSIVWPANTQRIEHLPPAVHRDFYNAQRFTLNITRADMIRAGYSPSVRLFEAAACGVPVISDYWEGLHSIFEAGKEILVSRSSSDTLAFLREMDETERLAIGRRARQKVLEAHSAAQRVKELLMHVEEVYAGR